MDSVTRPGEMKGEKGGGRNLAEFVCPTLVTGVKSYRIEMVFTEGILARVYNEERVSNAP